jgi:amphi-Trp domain-containing protein
VARTVGTHATFQSTQVDFAQSQRRIHSLAGWRTQRILARAAARAQTDAAARSRRHLHPHRPTTMSEEETGRDVEKVYNTRQFVEKLRRLADALEAGQPFTIQVANQRLKVPATAQISVEHEQEGGDHELEFQLTWSEEPN